MRQFLSIFLLTLGLSPTLSAQREVLSETDTIIIVEDSLYFFVRTTVADNGTAINDTATTKKFLGDSTQAATFVYNSSWDIENQRSAAMRRAYANKLFTREYNNLADLWEMITDTTLQSENVARLKPYYDGKYRVGGPGITAFNATLIQLPSGALRLENDDDQTRYNFIPKTRTSFRINYGGTWYDMHYSFNNANDFRVYEDEGRALGPRTLLITKRE